MDLATSYQGTKVLVTGDTGFKGSWLATWLMHLGAEVLGYALPVASELDNFSLCRLDDRFIHRDGDVRDHAALASFVREHRPSIVFHLAAQSLVLESYTSPRETFDTNVMGTVNLLEAVRAVPEVKAVVVVTSDKCYVSRESAVHREDDALGGADPYSASKAAAEIVTAAMRSSFFAASGPAVATARAGNVIGAGDWARNRLMPDCIRALREQQTIQLRHPSAVRPWQHVLDALHGYLQLGARLTADRAAATAWNFGPDASASVVDLVDAVIRCWGSGERRTEQDANAPAEAPSLRLDSAKAREQLGWRPVLDFARAIEWTVEGYRAELAGAASVFEHRVQQIRHFEGHVRV